jgi:splicing factor U2AF subunit
MVNIVQNYIINQHLVKQILFKNLYLSLENSSQKADKSFIVDDITEERIQEHFDDTFEELFVELERKYGEIDL